MVVVCYQRLVRLAYSSMPETVMERLAVQAFLDGLRDTETRQALRLSLVPASWWMLWRELWNSKPLNKVAEVKLRSVRWRKMLKKEHAMKQKLGESSRTYCISGKFGVGIAIQVRRKLSLDQILLERRQELHRPTGDYVLQPEIPLPFANSVLKINGEEIVLQRKTEETVRDVLVENTAVPERTEMIWDARYCSSVSSVIRKLDTQENFVRKITGKLANLLSSSSISLRSDQTTKLRSLITKYADIFDNGQGGKGRTNSSIKKWKKVLLERKSRYNSISLLLKRPMSHKDLKEIFLKAVESVQPRTLIDNEVKLQSRHLLVREQRYPLHKPCYMVGFGKAVLSMATAMERVLGDHLKKGVVTVPVGIFEKYEKPCGSKIEYIEGAKNNLPDKNAERGALMIKSLAERLSVDDLLIVLISGIDVTSFNTLNAFSKNIALIERGYIDIQKKTSSTLAMNERAGNSGHA
ncbi:hypothetical protein NQ318_008689 [Aromia moschata]|uniref:MOFRL-associated domain-containing protein n=1 Tax=Aromia moschata TaxID=1265417 RepID=A0AAV8X7H0_9CUCU|nr:hypothetical protein NQ318_008689 [Aromia moschata]